MSIQATVVLNQMKHTNTVKGYSLKELNETFQHIKKQYQADKILNESIISHLFVVLKEIVVQTTGLITYDSQIIAAIELYNQKIIEMKTGEGKTLAAIYAACLFTLEGESCHIVTVNDYLAKRDSAFAKPILSTLDLSCTYITNDSTQAEKKVAYGFDVVYITNRCLCADYITHYTATATKDLLFQPFHAIILDEADYVLIDSGLTPFTISKKSITKKELILKVTEFTKICTEEDYYIDEEDRQPYLTLKGIEKAEQYFNLGKEGYYASNNREIRPYIQKGLMARFYYIKDKDYIVINEKVYLLNEMNGHINKTSRLINKQHQMLEAKEGVPILEDTSIAYSVTYYSLFKQYPILCGMSGTIATEKTEMKETYRKKIVEIEPNVKTNRIDNMDNIYETKEERDLMAIQKIKALHQQGRPVLVISEDIKEAELFSQRLKEEKIEHNLLTAKNDNEEAEILKHAGDKGMVCVSTNMVGRGVDIPICDEVDVLGGLFLLGLGRFSSRRADNQLRGRTGRQGRHGESQFYVSLEDNLNASYTKNLSKLSSIEDLIKSKRGFQGESLGRKQLRKVCDDAQKEKESNDYHVRKSVLEFNTPTSEEFHTLFSDKIAMLQMTKVDFIENFLFKIIDKSKQDEYSKFIKNSKENLFIEIKRKVAELINHNWIQFFETDKQHQHICIYASYRVFDPYRDYVEANEKRYHALLVKTREDIMALLANYVREDK